MDDGAGVAASRINEMNDDPRKRLKEIFDAALQINLAERQQFVDEKCAGDEALRAEIISLLASSDSAGNFMQTTAIAEVADVIESKTEIVAGHFFGHYEIIKQIGAGGMGEVFLALDTKLERKVAVKILSKKFSRHESNLLRFIYEAKAASSLNHPNILTIYEINEQDNIHYIISEFVEGRTLREIICDEFLNLAELLEITIQIAKGLAAAHEARLIHRDIKPENIIVRPDDLVKILDFGLAKLISVNDSSAAKLDNLVKRNETAKGIILGTVNYMSPEQAKGETVDERTDLFSFGAVIYEIVTGKTPFGADSLSEAWTKLLNSEPLSFKHFNVKMSTEFERIIFKSLAKDKNNRYRSAKELLVDLKAFQRSSDLTVEIKSDFLTRQASDLKTYSTEILNNFKVPPNNLTKNFPTLIGREKEIAEIKALLKQTDVKLVTLTGIGGVGKTTLSRTIAGEMLSDFADGVFFVEMAVVSDEELVFSNIAQTLNIKSTSGKSIHDALFEYLVGKKILIIIDNFEQLIDAATKIAELLCGSDNLKILVTSRIILRLSYEREYVVSSLAFPAKNPLREINFSDDIKDFAAVRLFIERAKQIKPNFNLTEENRASIAEICARLEGLPLAIELAAARVKILSTATILSKLENSLNLLTGGAKDLPARQQTMRGAISWSYDLLDEDEKSALRLMSVFNGGFTFEAAEFVINNSSPAFLDALEIITSLVDKSLLTAKEQNGGEMRFRMLEVVRDYALELLETSSEAEIANKLHADFFLALGENAEPHLQSANSVKWINCLEEEHDNLRAALGWLLENDVPKAARLAASIRHLWAVHANLNEGGNLIEAVLERGADVISSSLKFKLLTWLGLFRQYQGNHQKAREIFEKGLAEGNVSGDFHQIATFNRCLGILSFQQNDFFEARNFLEKGLKISRETNDLKGFAYSLVFLGDIDRLEGNLDAARPLFEESLKILTKIGDKQATSVNLCNLGAIAYLSKDYNLARYYYDKALKIALELNDKQAISYAFDGFAALALKHENFLESAQMAGAAERLRESINSEAELAERRFRDDYLAELRAKLDDEIFRESYEKGCKLKIEEIVLLTTT